jgi:ubiquinone biosynthesis protein COQ9
MAPNTDPVLLAILGHVPFDGWSVAAMRAGARDAGLDPDRLPILFPGGMRDLATAFADWVDRAMVAAATEDGVGLAELRIRDRIEALVIARLTVMEPHKEAVRAALGFLALPQNADLGLRVMARTVDAVWRAAGDRATDFSFYTKRGLLAAVLAATTLHWLDDTDEGFNPTRRFLRARIGNVIALQSLRRQCQILGDRLPDPVRFFRSAGEAFARSRPSWK